MDSNRTESDKKYSLVISLIFSMIMAVILRCYSILDEVLITNSVKDIVKGYIKGSLFSWQTYIMFVIIFVIFFMLKKYDAIGRFIYKYRYAIMGVLTVTGIALGISGSSIGVWCDFTNTKDTGLLLGISRKIRSDEWAVSLPTNISQFYHSNGFDYFSDSINGTMTDYFMGYRQPVRSIAMLLRPFVAGYVFLPMNQAVAFFWCTRFAALFMICFEFSMLITDKKKKMSLLMAVIITFSPVVQWWFATALVDLIIFSLLSILLFNRYIKCNNTLLRIPYVIGIMWCAACFIMTLYPSWAVPFAYVILGFIIWIIMNNYKECKMKIADWLVIAGGIVILGSVIYGIFSKSSDAIAITSNTAYPGDRLETGGGQLLRLFSSVTGMSYAMTDIGSGGNMCESSMFFDFFPISYVLAGIVIFRDKIKDKLLIILTAVSAVLGAWCIFSFPEILAKITLLSNSQAGRTAVVFSFLNVLITFRALSLMKKPAKAYTAVGIGIGTALVTAVLCYIGNRAYYSVKIGPKMTIAFMLFNFIILAVVFTLALLYKNNKCKKTFALVLIIIATVGGVIVNPVRRGVDAVNNIEWVKEISSVTAQDKNAIWIIEEESLPFNNIGLLCGAKTLNATNVYPNLGVWQTLDPSGKYEDIYNRYAHVKIVLKEDGAPVFEYGEARDCFTLYATIESLRAAGVKYITSHHPIENGLTTSGMERINDNNEYFIYRIQ